MIKTFNTDNLPAMLKMPDNAFDFGIVDPPYGIGATKMQMGTHTTRSGDGYPGISTATKIRKKNRLNSGGGKLKNRILNQSNCDWDSAPPPIEYFKQLFRVTKHQIIFGGNYFPLPVTRGIIAWDKKQPWKNFSQFELIWTSFDFPAKVYRYSTTGGANKEDKIHPTQKPVVLYRRILNDIVPPGSTILDTHGGSNSLALACYELNYDLTVYEINTQIFTDAQNRLKNFIKSFDSLPKINFQK